MGKTGYKNCRKDKTICQRFRGYSLNEKVGNMKLAKLKQKQQNSLPQPIIQVESWIEV